MSKKLVNLTLIQVKQVLQLERELNLTDSDYQRVFADRDLIKDLENYILIRIPNIYSVLNHKEIDCYRVKNDGGQRKKIKALIVERIKGKKIKKVCPLVVSVQTRAA